MTTELTRVFDRRSIAQSHATKATILLTRRGIWCRAQAVGAPGGWQAVIHHQPECDGHCADRRRSTL
jgi:hypothetical protein